MRLVPCPSIIAAVAMTSAAPLNAQTVGQVLQQTRDTYVAMKSYTDAGTVLQETGSPQEPFTTKHQFTTAFRRSPRAFVLDFHKEGGDRFVIWGDPDAFHTWWKTTGAQYDMPNPNNITAISGSAPNTANAATKIPTLLYGKSQLAALLLAFADPVLDGTEPIANRRCYRVSGRASDTYTATGREVNVHRITVWIDAESHLVRQVREEWKGVAGALNRLTTIYDPHADSSVDEARLKFAPPPNQ